MDEEKLHMFCAFSARLPDWLALMRLNGGELARLIKASQLASRAGSLPCNSN